MTAGAGCAWTATANVAWITVTSSSGSGNGTVSYSVAANTGTARTGTLTIAGQTFTVNQAGGAGIRYRRERPAASGGSGSVGVTAGTGCAWTAVSNAAWITITSGASGIGQRDGELLGGGQHGHGAHRDDDDRGPDVHGEPGGRVQVFDIARPARRLPLGGQRERRCDDRGRLRMDGGGQRRMDHGHAVERHGHRDGELLGGSQHGHGAHGDGDDRGADVHGEPGGSGARTRYRRPARRSASGGSGSVSVTAGHGLRLDGGEQRRMDHGHAVERHGQRDGELLGGRQHGHGAHGDDDDRGADVHGEPGGRVHVFDIADQRVGFRIRRQRERRCDGRRGLRLDGGEQRRVDHGHAGGSGTGNGTVSYSVAANTGAARTGTVTIAGQTFTVNQAGGCTYSISPDERVGFRFGRQRERRCDGRGRLRVDGGEQRRLDHGHAVGGHGQRDGELLGGGQHGHGAHGDGDDRGQTFTVNQAERRARTR